VHHAQRRGIRLPAHLIDAWTMAFDPIERELARIVQARGPEIVEIMEVVLPQLRQISRTFPSWWPAQRLGAVYKGPLTLANVSAGLRGGPKLANRSPRAAGIRWRGPRQRFRRIVPRITYAMDHLPNDLLRTQVANCVQKTHQTHTADSVGS